MISADEKFEQPIGEHGFRRSYFTRVSVVLVKKNQANRAVSLLSKKRLTDPSEWELPEVIDDPYLLELPCRDTWPNGALALGKEGHGPLRELWSARPILSYV